MRIRRRHPAAVWALAVWSLAAGALAMGASVAHAEEVHFQFERFRPVIDASGILDVESGDVGKSLAWNIAAFGNYSLNPLVLVKGQKRGSALVAHRIGLNVTAALSLFEWIELGIDAPAVLFQTRDTRALGDDVTNAADITAAGFSDLHALVMVRILRAKDQLVDLAIIPAVTFPTAFPADETGNYLGEGQLTFVPELALSRQFDDGPVAGLKLALNVGYRLRPTERKFANVVVGHEITYRGGIGYRFGSVPVELDLTANGATRAFQPFSSGYEENPLEVIGGVAWDPVSWLRLTAGVGKGILSGAGTPDLRAFVGLRFFFEPAPVAPIADRDGDGIADDADRCPNEAEDKDGFEDADGCPDPDNDHDGILDGSDNCPGEPEDLDRFDDDDGCPEPDNDGDGVLDTDDRCRLIPGVADNKGCPPEATHDRDGDGVPDDLDACPETAGMAAFHGCADTDKDGIPDPTDKCPGEPETINGVEDEDGCPDTGKTSVNLTADKIEILDKVYFDVGKDTIQARSFKLLGQVASVLKAHLEIRRVRIEGHTDSDGPDDLNMALSDRRAKAVARWLSEHDVEAGRLEPQGFGETRPVAPNSKKSDKEKNRRVEFVIVETEGKSAVQQ